MEDILQDTFIKVFQSVKAGKYSENGKFISWVMRIAHNLIIDHFRMIKQMNTISNDKYESDLFNLKRLAEDNIEDDMIKLQIHQDVRKMISHWWETKRKNLSFAVLIYGLCFPYAYESKLSTQRKNKARHFRARLFLLSGWQDSNLRPSGPKPDALTGLRYTP